MYADCPSATQLWANVLSLGHPGRAMLWPLKKGGARSQHPGW